MVERRLKRGMNGNEQIFGQPTTPHHTTPHPPQHPLARQSKVDWAKWEHRHSVYIYTPGVSPPLPGSDLSL